MGSQTDLHNGCDSDLVYEDQDQRHSVMNSLNKLRREKKFCDVEMEVGGHNIPAHRAVMASSSCYLFEKFIKDEEDCQCQNVFKLKDVDYDSFNYLLDYMYTGRLVVQKDHVNAVYQAAIKLKMTAAASACAKFMAAQLSSANCLGIQLCRHRQSLIQSCLNKLP